MTATAHGCDCKACMHRKASKSEYNRKYYLKRRETIKQRTRERYAERRAANHSLPL